jgi:hypothetical protein
MEHETPDSFIVNPPVGNSNLEFRAECIKYVEPYVRENGIPLDWNKFNSLVFDGSLTGIISGDAEQIVESLKKFKE